MTKDRNFMTEVEWLYGITSHQWSRKSYKEVMIEKYVLGKQLRTQLVYGPDWYGNPDYNIDSRLNDVTAAINYNHERVKELL